MFSMRGCDMGECIEVLKSGSDEMGSADSLIGILFSLGIYF